jgi:hypothetical protein
VILDKTSEAALQQWWGADISPLIQNKALVKAYMQWALVKHKTRPRLFNFMPDAAKSNCEILLCLSIGGDYVYLHQTPRYVQEIGIDLRGSLISELKFGTANSMKLLYDQCREKSQPVYVRYISSVSQEHVFWEALILPLSATPTGNPILTLSLLSPLDEKTDVLELIYDRSAVALISAIPTTNGSDKMLGGRILTMNKPARDLLRVGPQSPVIHYVGQLFAFFSESLLWTRKEMSVLDATTTITFDGPYDMKYFVKVEMLNQFILISIEPSSTVCAAPRLASGALSPV